MLEYEFKGAFLNEEGADMESKGIDTDGKQEYYEFRLVTIDLESIESYFEIKPMHNNPICNVRTKTGVDWTLAISYKDLRAIKKSLLFTRAN